MSNHLIPIALTNFGETLLEYPFVESPYTEGYTDESELSTCVGIHGICNGWVDIKEISITHNALVCRYCNLRIVIPKTINTYGKLREFCKNNMEVKP